MLHLPSPLPLATGGLSIIDRKTPDSIDCRRYRWHAKCAFHSCTGGAIILINCASNYLIIFQIIRAHPEPKNAVTTVFPAGNQYANMNGEQNGVIIFFVLSIFILMNFDFYQILAYFTSTVANNLANAGHTGGRCPARNTLATAHAEHQVLQYFFTCCILIYRFLQ